MMALDLKPGDEIILPVFTYVATAEVIALLGLTPVMVDVDADTFCIDVNLIEAKITSKTKAIVPVHLFGQCANMDSILEIASRHSLFVIEDTAQAIGATWLTANGQRLTAGAAGDIGTTSFFPSKNLGCYGDGGALMTNNDELAAKIRMICNHGQSVQYVHDVIGVNSRLDSIQAAVLSAKLPHLKSYAASRNQAAEWYDELLGGHPNIIIPKRNEKSTHVFHQYTIRIQNPESRIQTGEIKTLGDNIRDKIRKALAEKGIPSMVYYPIELHKQKAFEKYWDGVERFPVSEELVQTVLSLPMHTEMTREMVAYICNELLSIIS